MFDFGLLLVALVFVWVTASGFVGMLVVVGFRVGC